MSTRCWKLLYPCRNELCPSSERKCVYNLRAFLTMDSEIKPHEGKFTVTGTLLLRCLLIPSKIIRSMLCSILDFCLCLFKGRNFECRTSIHTEKELLRISCAAQIRYLVKDLAKTLSDPAFNVWHSEINLLDIYKKQ